MPTPRRRCAKGPAKFRKEQRRRPARQIPAAPNGQAASTLPCRNADFPANRAANRIRHPAIAAKCAARKSHLSGGCSVRCSVNSREICSNAGLARCSPNIKSSAMNANRACIAGFPFPPRISTWMNEVRYASCKRAKSMLKISTASKPATAIRRCGSLKRCGLKERSARRDRL